MVRVVTSNYGADATTQFAWATAGSDQFSREDDLYNLAQAVEHHTHGATRGLAVTRLATGAVDAAAIAGLAVGTSALAALSVTNAKLAAGAVTMDKITFPLVQATDNFVGGFRLRDSTNTYQVGYYIAANGLAVFGAGPIAGISTSNLILGQAGQVSVGAVQGGGRFNVFPTANGIGTGMRVYSNDQVHYGDFSTDAGARIIIGGNGTSSIHIHPTNGYVSIGATPNDTARLAVVQAAATAAEGLLVTNGTGFGSIYADASNRLVISSGTTPIFLERAVAALSPGVDGAVALGTASLRWSALAVTGSVAASTGVFSGAVSMAGLTATTGGFSGGVSMTGLIATTGTFSGAVSAASYGAVSATTGIFSSTLTVGGGTTLNADASTRNILPAADNTYVLGSAALKWLNIVVLDGFKPGGGSWTATSDDRAKMKTKFRAYTTGLDTLLQLHPTYYTYNGDYGTPRGKEFVGLSAQETQTVAPELVGSWKVPKNHGDPEEDVLTIDSSNIPYMLINAVKELAGRVSKLEAH